MKQNNKNILAEIFSSKGRSEIFRILLGLSGKPLHLREIQRRCNMSVTPIRQELNKLVKLELLSSRKDGNRIYYESNRQHPLFNELHRIVLKTTALGDVLKSALNDEKIKIAFVFGSFARNEEKASSDIDLLVIGDIGMRFLVSMISGISEQIGREINPHILKEHEFKQRLLKKDHFISRVFEADKIFIKGNQNELERLVE